jgi:4-hydroxybenzoate polyprenyltransferase
MAATILWQLGFDTIYGFQDMEDDARIGVKSTSRLMAGRARGVYRCLCYAADPGAAAGGRLACLAGAGRAVLARAGCCRVCLFWRYQALAC